MALVATDNPLLAALTFLSAGTAAIVGAIVVPSLLLLYFLKLRRTERVVSSTLLWRRAVYDLQVNSPFQKLRKNLLLFLQLLILAAVLLAISQPVINVMRQPDKNVLILVDRSASMKTEEQDGRTRLSHAKEAANTLVQNLPDDCRVMVIVFAERAEVACSFTNDKRRLVTAIDGIEPTDSHTRIGEALQLAVAYSGQSSDVAADGSAAPTGGNADIRIFTDGHIADADDLGMIEGKVTYHRVGNAGDNVGIVAFDVRRDAERPGMLSVFARVENFGEKPVTADVSILLDGKLLSGAGSIQQITLGPAQLPTTVAADAADLQPAFHNVIFELNHESGGLIEVRLHRSDALSIDNVVQAPIDPPRELSVLCVCERRRPRSAFERVLRAVGVEHTAWMTSSQYETVADAELIRDGRSRFDLVVLDNHDTGRLPPGNYLFLGGVPKIDSVTTSEYVEGQPLVSWQENHPLIRPADFSNVFIARWRRLILPPTASILVEGEDSPVIAAMNDPGHRYVIAAFDVEESNFLLSIPFVVLMQNCTRGLTDAGLSDRGRPASPGDTLTVTVPGGAEKADVKRPDGVTESMDVSGRTSLSYGKTRDAGVYRVSFDDANKTTDVFSINTLSSNESNIRPLDNLRLAQRQIDTAAGDVKVSRPLWPWLIAAALIILMFEWWVYNRRVML